MFLIIRSIVLTPNWLKFFRVKLENSVSEEFRIKKKKEKQKTGKRQEEKINNVLIVVSHNTPLYLYTDRCVQ